MLRAIELTTDLNLSCVDVQVCNQTTGWQVFCLHECKFVPLTQAHKHIPTLFSERTLQSCNIKPVMFDETVYRHGYIYI